MRSLGDLAADWQQLNQLLDEALSLPSSERDDWLRALPQQHAVLKDTLARLLQARHGIETGDFLGTLPKLDAGPAGAASGPDSGAPRPGDAVGPWRLLREVGIGGMGSVWLAERADGAYQRRVALKLPRLTWARGLAERMARERDILATLEHPHIARLYDAGIDTLGRPWLALEYVQGRPIDAHADERALDIRQRVQLLLQVCEAVAYAHSRLVIHRDLKPGNILVTDDGQVKLLDFGIAKLVQGETTAATALTERVGRALTLDYASPEQVRGDPLTTASDVYSLGVVAYELLSGSKPYRLRRGSAAELEEAIENADASAASTAAKDPAVRKALRGDLDAILHQALHKAAAQRYQSVDALARDLARHLAGEPVAARSDTLALRARRLARRHPLPLAVAGGIAVALLGGANAQAAVMVALGAGVLLALWQRREAVRQAELARAEAAEARRQRERAEAVKGFALGLFDSANIERGGTTRTTALELLQRAEADLAAGPAGDPEILLELSVSLGRALLGLDQAEAALRLLQQADTTAGARVPIAHPLRRELVMLHAQALQQLQRHAEAAPLLDALVSTPDLQPVQAAVALRLRALGCHALGHFTQALADLREAVRRAEAGGDPLELLVTLNEQTRLLGYLSHDDRITSAARAVEVGARCDPRRHALPILRARELLTLAHCLQGDARQGLAGYPPIIEQLERDLGVWHSRVAEAHNAYAAAAYQCGRAEEAIASLRRTIAIDEAQHGPDAQPLRLARVGLGGILANEGFYEEGLVLMRQACEEFDAREGVQHPLAALALNRWVAALIKAGQLDEAAARLEALRLRCEGDERALDDWRQESARWLRARGRSDEALELLQSMHQRRLAAPARLGVAAWWELLGGVLVDAGRPAEAMAPLDTALAVYEARQPYGSVAIARTRLELGRARLGLGETSTAVREFQASLAYWEARGPDRPPAVETAGWLALALHRAGEHDEAGRLAAQASSGPWPAEVDRAAGLRRSLAEAGLVPRSAA